MGRGRIGRGQKARERRADADARPVIGRRLTRHDILTHPINLVPIPVAIIMGLGRHFGFVADQPLWLIVGVVFLAQFVSMGFSLMFEPGGPHARPITHVAVEISMIGLVIYTTGWGAVLGIGFVFAAVGHMNSDGSRLGIPAIVFTNLAIAGGELIYALGYLKTISVAPHSHGFAVLEAAGLSAVIWMMSFELRQKEIAQGDVRERDNRLRALVEHASDAIVVIDPRGAVQYASPAVERLLGYTPEQLPRLGRGILHDDHADMAMAMFEDLLSRPGSVTWIELPIRHADGEFHWFEIGITNRLDDVAVQGLVCNMRDVTERRTAQEQLTFQAHHDALTRLPNRWLFLERLEQAQREGRDGTDYVAVMFLDVDRFKIINDSLGHEIGDRMLVAVADRLGMCLRDGDIVARFGGDEFTVLLDALPDIDIALNVAERIVNIMRDPLLIDGHELFVSASVGVALSRAGDTRAQDLLRQADLAMYVAKEKGRGRWELFDPTLAPQVVERLELEGDLWRALDHGELIVQYQPELALTSGNVIAAEALIRWNHPRRGLLEPDSFVPMAEESSLIVAIDRFVMREACTWARRWAAGRPADQPLVVSVNLSPRFMRQSDVVGDITAVLRETGVDPRCVQLEITERSAVTDLETTCQQLHQLRALGVRVAVDDFGTGYSSLSYLKRLPIDVLKLDKSFVDGLDGAPADLAIVQAIVTMGHALGVKVTAEGVERKEQAMRLRELGCDSAMGFLWSRSVPPDKLGALVEAGFMPDGGVRNGVVVPLRARA